VHHQAHEVAPHYLDRAITAEAARDEALAKVATMEADHAEADECLCEIADALGVDTDAPLADIVTEIVEALPEVSFDRHDGTFDEGNVRERAEHAAESLAALLARATAAEAARDSAMAALAALREVLENILNAQTCGFGAVRSVLSRDDQATLVRAVQANASTASLATAYTERVRREALLEAATKADDEHGGEVFAAWLRALADEKRGEHG
jgi:hypothetical protein